MCSGLTLPDSAAASSGNNSITEEISVFFDCARRAHLDVLDGTEVQGARKDIEVGYITIGVAVTSVLRFVTAVPLEVQRRKIREFPTLSQRER